MAQSQVGKIYVGANQMFPGIYVPPSGPVVPTSGLIAWFDADDYTSGATWTDRSANGNNLTLTGTYAKNTTYGPTILFNGGYGSRGSVAGWASTTDVTYVEIIRVLATSNFQASWAIQGTNQLTNFQLGGAGDIYTWVGAKTGWILNTQDYSTTKTTFVARRVQSGFNNTSGLNTSYGDDSSVPLTNYGAGNFTLARTPTDTTYTLGASVTIRVATPENNITYDMPGYYGASLFYNRILTDQEVQDIYDYYKSTYSLV